ncbi:MAG: CRISPR-associated endonuclease Cas2 [Acidilobaceae archaeon]
MPYVVVAYDISDDIIRSRVSEKLKSMGFTRIQRSLYVRRGGAYEAKEAARALARIIDYKTDNVIVMVVPWESLERAFKLGVFSYAESISGYAIL